VKTKRIKEKRHKDHMNKELIKYHNKGKRVNKNIKRKKEQNNFKGNYIVNNIAKALEALFFT